MTKKFFTRHYEIPIETIFIKHEDAYCNGYPQFHFLIRDKVTKKTDRVQYCPYYNVTEPWAGLERAIEPFFKSKKYWGYSTQSKQHMTYENALEICQEVFAEVYEGVFNYYYDTVASESFIPEGFYRGIEVPGFKKMIKKGFKLVA